MEEAQRLHQVLELAVERLAGVLDDARFERRDGYTFMALPTFPVRDLNGVWAETDAAAAELEDALAEAEELGTPFTVMVRAGRTPAVEEAARTLGFTSTTRIPGMVVRPDELQLPSAADAQIIRVETAELEGLSYYLARVGNADVSTAAGFTIGDAVALFSVATPAEHRGRGYGAAITAHAAQEGFAAGADLAALQSSEIGESVYL